MATVITEECINCGACEPECPNTAIYQGGVEWEMDGKKHAALSNDIFYIVPEKCTECVGFFDHEACAAVCPVDCCVPDPNRPETEEQLLARARELHPEMTFGDDFPSRFRKAEDGAAVPATAAEAAPAAEAKPAAVPAPPPKPAAAPSRAAGGRVEKAVKPPPAPKAPPVEKRFPGELPEDFDELLARLQQPTGGTTGFLMGLLGVFAMPVVGALPDATKRRLEEAFGNRALFSAVGATALNVVLNFFVYPIVLGLLGAVVLERQVFTLQFESFLFYGVTLAALETAWRLREGLFRGVPSNEMTLGPALYGPLLVPLIAPFTRLAARVRTSGTVAFDGFYDSQFDEKRDRQRRYGEVYRLEDVGRGYLLRFEFPHQVPPSSVKEELGVPDEMPPYDYDLSLANGSLVVRGRVADPLVRKVASGAPSFPPDFTTRIDLGAQVRGFKHRYRDEEKVLEVLLVKQG
jgi:ferredoxin